MHRPFFTILVPTRDRPHLLSDTLQSVLSQDFQDYELLISDNYNDERTQRVIDSVRGDSRVRVVRTDKVLNMPDHWEWASRHVGGEYVLFLPDRAFLVQGALVALHRAITSQAKPVEVCAWPWGWYDEERQIVWDGVSDGEPKFFSSRQLVHDYVDSLSGSHVLPRGLNSCYRFDVAERIWKKYGRFFHSICPDFTSAFLLLSECEDVLEMQQPLFYEQGRNVSNGNTGNYDPTAFVQSLGLSDMYKDVPLSVPLGDNFIFIDFLAMRALAQGVLAELPIHWARYFAICYQEIEKRPGYGVPAAFVKEMRDEWRRAFRACTPELRWQIRKEIFFRFPIIIASRIRHSRVGDWLEMGKRLLVGPPFRRNVKNAAEAGNFL